MVEISVSITIKLLLWVVNFICSIVALFISLYLLISHDDMKEYTIAPAELANSLSKVILSFTLQCEYV